MSPHGSPPPGSASAAIFSQNSITYSSLVRAFSVSWSPYGSPPPGSAAAAILSPPDVSTLALPPFFPFRVTPWKSAAGQSLTDDFNLKPATCYLKTYNPATTEGNCSSRAQCTQRHWWQKPVRLHILP